MFNDDRSDFAVPIAGFFMIAVTALLLGLTMFNVKYDFSAETVNEAVYPLLSIVSLLGIINGAIALKKAYLVEGFSFIAFSSLVFAYSFSLQLIGTLSGFSLIIGVTILLTFLFLAMMAYKGDVKDLALINVLLGIAFCVIFAFEDGFLFAGIFMILVALVCGYVVYNDWSYVQDVLAAYEEAMMYEDGECGCGCDDGCCCDDECGCGCEEDRDDECCCEEHRN